MNNAQTFTCIIVAVVAAFFYHLSELDDNEITSLMDIKEAKGNSAEPSTVNKPDTLGIVDTLGTVDKLDTVDTGSWLYGGLPQDLGNGDEQISSRRVLEKVKVHMEEMAAMDEELKVNCKNEHRSCVFWAR